MLAPFSKDLRCRVIWLVHVLQNSVGEASFFLGVSKRKVERYISKCLVTGDGVRGQEPTQIGKFINKTVTNATM